MHAQLLLAAVALFASVEQTADAGDKVWICHATSSATNPYNLIEVSANAWDGEGRNDHTLHEGDFLAPDGALTDCEDPGEEEVCEDIEVPEDCFATEGCAWDLPGGFCETGDPGGIEL